MRNLLLVFALLLTTGVSAQPVLSPIRLPADGPTAAAIDPRLIGVWQSIGDGYILEATADKIKLYNYTDFACYPETDDYQTSLLNSSALFAFTHDTLCTYLHDFGNKSAYLQSGRRYVKRSGLPKNCSFLTQSQQNDPEFIFDVFWHTLKENYAFEKERNLNWVEIYKAYKPKVSKQTSKEDLLKMMGEIIKLTKDHHTKIIYQGKTLQYTKVPSASLLYENFSKQDTLKDFDTYVNLFFKSNYEGISKDLLKGKGKKVANGKIEWGHLTADVGYIHVHSLTGFAAKELSRKQHLDTLNSCMEQIMRAFGDKKAIVVDVSFNYGGYDAAALTIAGYFTDKPVHVYDKYTYHKGTFNKDGKVYVSPAGKYNFVKPVYVLTTDISRSAAESFAMQMKALPNVTLVGAPTLGILSDMLGKSIGEFYLTLSNEKYLTPDGQSYEAIGVPVEEPLEVFPVGNMFHGHRDAVLALVKSIQKGWEKQPLEASPR